MYQNPVVFLQTIDQVENTLKNKTNGLRTLLNSLKTIICYLRNSLLTSFYSAHNVVTDQVLQNNISVFMYFIQC